jgi:hypothetical protein
MARIIDSLEGYSAASLNLRDHYYAIGLFVSYFVRIEIYLPYLLRHILRLNEDLTRALIGEARAGDLMSTIKRLSKVMKDDEFVAKAIENTFEKIGDLKTKRDHIAHRLFYVKDDEMAFYNIDIARSPESSSIPSAR